MFVCGYTPQKFVCLSHIFTNLAGLLEIFMACVVTCCFAFGSFLGARLYSGRLEQGRFRRNGQFCNVVVIAAIKATRFFYKKVTFLLEPQFS